MPIAQKIKHYMESASWIRGMFEEGIRLKQQYGEDNIFDLSLGNPVMEPPPAFHATLRQLLQDPPPGMHRYMPNVGYAETRAAVAAQLAKETGVAFSAEHIIMCVGAAAGINVVLRTLLDPGDEVLFFAPYFVEYHFYVDYHGGVAKVVPTDAHFDLDLEALEAALTPRSKVVLMNSPNNPTGVIYPATTLKALGELLQRKERQFNTKIYLLSDEPYKKLTYGGLAYPEIYSHHANAISVTSHAKDLALPGERIGYIAVHPNCADLKDLIGGMSFTTRTLGFVNAPALMQRALVHLQGVTVDMQQYERKRNFLCDNLSAMGYQLVKPQGAFYIFPKTPIADDVAFVEALQAKHILTVPGRGFGGPGHFRIAYCVEDRTIERAMDGFRAVAKEFGMG
ncbi:MAG TPA: pyridoxal phosphate-dependent aminotransferase [Candidatus Tectomicrobia bacterium]|jgi:aspartate aminotransferase|nr:pyridoxal phosphate-dependent aminotransferase [Candidatus Tectomicrobia bacterium]